MIGNVLIQLSLFAVVHVDLKLMTLSECSHPLILRAHLDLGRSMEQDPFRDP